MKEVIVNDEVIIENLIYEIRGTQVMLDSDLARLYECANGTKDINKAVKRNIERFPNCFMFQLTDKEYDNLRYQIGTSKLRGGRRYNPYVFTEQGVAMLSSILHSEIAIKMSIQI
ncbi:MAG: ORF6N domain-containing protein, partial [Romboutsia sp.]|nr:ORF6N domain-containing protein [Romboutsia sp.]